MSEINYYDWLDVEKTSSQDHIKQTYITQATKWHPYKNSAGKSRCTKAFCELSEAYLVLSTPDLKSFYDTYGSSQLKSQYPSYNLQSFSLEDALSIYSTATRTIGIISVCLQNEKWHENNEIFTGGLLKNNYGKFVLDDLKAAQEPDSTEKYVKSVKIERDGRRVIKTITTFVKPDGSSEVVEEEKEEPLI